MSSGKEDRDALIRAFIALALPEHVKQDLDSLHSMLKGMRKPIRWVAPSGIHVTLKFLGERHPALIQKIAAIVKTVAAGIPPLTVSIRGSGVFPDQRRPRVIWIGIENGRDELTSLQKLIDREVQRITGIPAEKRAFHPHLTLGRIKDPCPVDDILGFISESSCAQQDEFTVSSVNVYESILKPSGADYRIIEACPFGDAPSKEKNDGF